MPTVAIYRILRFVRCTCVIVVQKIVPVVVVAAAVLATHVKRPAGVGTVTVVRVLLKTLQTTHKSNGYQHTVRSRGGVAAQQAIYTNYSALCLFKLLLNVRHRMPVTCLCHQL